MSELSSVPTNVKQAYKLYPGEYPVVVIDNPGYTRRDELNLNSIVEQYELQAQLDKVIWIEHILSHSNVFNKLSTKAESWHVLIVPNSLTEELRATGEYIIPEKVLKALLSRCKNARKSKNSSQAEI